MAANDPQRDFRHDSHAHVDTSLAGLSGVVTGASGGIGRQVAVTLAAAGMHSLVLQHAVNVAAAEQTAHLVLQRGCRPISLQADCGSSAGCRGLVEDAFTAVGTPDVWVHVAGADVLTGAAADLDFDQKLQRLIDVDLVGTIAVSRELIRRWQQNPPIGSPPSLILIGWDQATEGMEGDAGQMFGPVKAAVEAFAKSLAQSVAPQIRVNTVAPGWIRTAWGEATSDYWDRRARGQALMARWGTPQDVAAAVRFLASPESEFITGQTLAVNGGFSRRWRSSTDDA
ncbi:MAG: SDR family oxidoreductase [Planctomycetaceae bacterium]|nr:MAG: SDR family oxidoreductase [Planctomycetaceae bacterium]